MEPLLEVGADIELRRQSVASWIENSVRPIANLIANYTLTIDDDEVRHEAAQFEVREYQLDAWGNVWAARQAGAKRALIHLATGLGKTSVAVLDAIKFQEEFIEANGREPKILFTCHKNEILEQAAERFRAFMPNASQGFFNGERKERDADVTFATLQSLYSDLDSFSPDDYDYIIDDEVHHAKADTFEQVVNYFTPAFRLGLTATPNRKDEKDIRELYGEEVYSKGLPEALAEGWLASPDYHIVFDDAVKEAMQSSFEATSLRALAELFDVQPRNEVIAKNIKEEMAHIGLEFGDVKTIVFCQNIEHAEEMATLLGGKAYHSEAPINERRRTFEDFKDGNLQVITTRDMFNEGVDVPDARLLVFLRSTSSQTIFEQQLGRGLRKHANKQRVSVLDFVANVERIAMIKDLADKVKRTGHHNLGGRTNDGDGTIIDGPKAFGHGLTIHTSNVDFDFDKMTVNLLEKYMQLSSPEPVPEGWVSVNAFSLMHGISSSSVLGAARKLDLEFGEYSFKGGIGSYLSPSDQISIYEVIAPLLERTPEHNISLSAFAKERNVSHTYLRKLLAQAGIELTRRRHGNSIATSLDPAEQLLAVNLLNSNAQQPPNGYVSARAFALENKVAPKTLYDIIDRENIDLSEYRFGQISSLGLSPDTQSYLRALVNKETPIAPEGYESIHSFSARTGIGRRALINLIEQYEVKLEKHKFGPKTVPSLSPDMQAKILSLPEVQIKDAPDDYISLVHFAKSNRVSPKTLRKIIDTHSISITKHRFGTKVTESFSPEIQEQIMTIISNRSD